MKPFSLIHGLLAISVALGAIIVWLLMAKPAPTVTQPASEVILTNRIVNYVSEQTPSSPPLAPRPSFSWSAVEAEDYRQYIANLRVIDCPEETIRDIILADINKLYAPREAPFKTVADPLAAVANQNPSGDTAAELALRKQDFERRKKLREVENEKATVIKELLGIDLPLEPLQGWHTRNYDRHETAINALPAHKRETVRTLQENYWQASDVLNDKYNLQRTPEYLAEYKQLNAQRRQQLQQMLTPDEFDEYEMRSSSVTTRLRTELSEFKPSAEEFKAIYRSKSEIEEPYGGTVRIDMTEGFNPQQQAEKQRESDNKLKELLGDERFAEYQRAQDPQYRQLAMLRDRFGLSQETTQQAYDLQREMNQNQQIFRNPNAIDPLQAQATQTFMAEQQNKLRQILGDRAYQALNRSSGGIRNVQVVE